jgi:hypothetical protein
MSPTDKAVLGSNIKDRFRFYVLGFRLGLNT